MKQCFSWQWSVFLCNAQKGESKWDYHARTLAPKPIIFNPGTEIPEFEKIAAAAGIEVIEACTLVMLRTGQY